MTAPDLASLPPEIAALLDAYAREIGDAGFGYETNPSVARVALESALAPLVRDAALGKALRAAVDSVETPDRGLAIKADGRVFHAGTFRGQDIRLTDETVALAAMLAAARTPEEER